MSIISQYLGFNDYLPVQDRYMDYEKVIVDEDHRILIDRERGKNSIEPFIVLIPQKKDFFWHNYHFTDYCQGFKYDYEIYPALYEYEKELKELISYLPELDKVMIEQGGIL